MQKGWDGSLPLYLSSRHVNYLDAGIDRDSVLNEIFGRYLTKGSYPNSGARKHKVVCYYSFNKVSTLYKEWNSQYKHSMITRRSVRSFAGKTLKRHVFLNILANSIAKIGETIAQAKRLGGLHQYTQSYGCAFNIYIVSYNIDGIRDGVYWVHKARSVMELFKEGNFRVEMSNVNWGMKAPLTANYTVILTVEPKNYAWRYRHDRALRNLMIEAGRIMHEFVIAAGCFGVQGVVTPATNDEMLGSIVDIVEDEIPFYTGSFGVS